MSGGAWTGARVSGTYLAVIEHRDGREWDVDEEHEAPRRGVDEPAADERPERAGDTG